MQQPSGRLMSGYMRIYNFIEQSFFFTLTRKIIGNLSFVFAFQAITLIWLYKSLLHKMLIRNYSGCLQQL